MIKNIFKNILNLIFPPKCIFCKSIISFNNNSFNNNNLNCCENVCEKCFSDLFFIPNSLVSIKKRESALNLQNYSKNYLSYKKYYFFDDCISVFYYKSLISKSICDFKFFNKIYYLNFFCDQISLIAKKAYQNIKFDYITYIPMFQSKEKQRGFNQSKLIAKKLSEMLGIELKELLVKIKDNKPQHSLSLKLREENIRDVYQFSDKQNVSQKTLLLIDDIVTSGHTLNEAAKVLKLSGAKQVFCATIASTEIKINKLI